MALVTIEPPPQQTISRLGRLIVIEGADGCGKTSVATALAKRYDADLIHFPNDESLTGPAIRRYLRKEWVVQVPDEECDGACYVPDDALSALAFQSMQITNRMETMPRILRAIYSGRDVVLARYWQSAWVYGQLDGLDPTWLVQVHAAMPQAAVNILLTLPAEECLARRAARDGALPPERYEGKLGFTQRVVRLYDQLWHSKPGPGSWWLVDASLPLGYVIAGAVEATQPL